MQEQLYNQCRQCLVQVESSVSAELMTIEVLQATLLLALYEFKHMHFARAWLSHARALRLVQILQLHRLGDGSHALIHLHNESFGNRSLEGDLEFWELQQTFWVAFILDRLSNTGKDWPVTLEESEAGISLILSLPSRLTHLD
jgi:hypothetical protein